MKDSMKPSRSRLPATFTASASRRPADKELKIRRIDFLCLLGATGLLLPCVATAGPLDKSVGKQKSPTRVTSSVRETQIPADVEEKIRAYVDTYKDLALGYAESMHLALTKFTLMMTSPSTQEAKADVLGAAVRATQRIAVDSMVEGLATMITAAGGPGVAGALKSIRSIANAVVAEQQRAGAARKGVDLRNAIASQYSAISLLRDKVVLRDGPADDPSPLKVFELDLGSAYLTAEDKGSFKLSLYDAQQRLLRHAVQSPDAIELGLYERWINAHFRVYDKDATGCIEYRYEFEDNAFSFVELTVQAPFGDKVADGLNRLIRERRVRAKLPIDLRVNKHAFFRMKNINPGGRSWYSGWLDPANRPILERTDSSAKHVLLDVAWRQQGSFR